MKKHFLPIAIFCLIISCEQKMPADLEATKSNISQRYNEINSMSISELKNLKSDVINYTNEANRRGISKNNDHIVNAIDDRINKLGGQNNTNNNSSNNYSNSEQESIRAYRAGFNDGQMGYGLPATETATADESYMAHGYNFSSADIYVYKMGYNDGMYGRTPQY